MANIAPYGKYYGVDDNGNPLSGGKLYTYEAGTTTPKETYTTAAGDVPNANPVVLDASGLADVWLGDGGYKFLLTDADDNTIFTVDNIGGSSDTAFGAEVNQISSNTNITSVYQNSANIVTGATTLSLLPAADAGEGFYFSVKNYGVSNVTIDPDASELIDGASTKTIIPGQSCIIICNGSTWYTLFLSTVSANGNNEFTGNNTFTGKILTPDDGELTIASGAITVTGVYHTVDTEGDAPTDDLVTINGGSDGELLILRTENDSRDVVIKTTGNIANGGVNDITLGNSNTQIVLQYDGAKSKWLVQSATAEQGAKADTALQPTGSGANLTGVLSRTAVASVPTTTGTAVTIVSGLPSTCVQVICFFNGVSVSGTDTVLIQLGDAGGFETTGYTGTVGGANTGNVLTVSSPTTGIQISSTGIPVAGTLLTGVVVFNLADVATNTWYAHGVISGTSGTTGSFMISGIKSLSQPLTSIQIIPSGANTFDAGSASATYLKQG